MSSAIVSGRENCEQLPSSEPLKAVHHTLVSSQDVLGLVVVEELLDSIWTEFDYVSSAIRVSDEVRLNSELRVVVGGVAPKDVDHKLLLRSGHLVDYLEGSLNHLYLFN